MILPVCFGLPIYLLLLVYCVANAEIPNDWDDPHDMRPSVEYLSFSDGPLPLSDYYKDNRKLSDCDLSDQMSRAYLKRTINLLLNAVYGDYADEESYTGHLYFQLDAKNFETLRNFANGGAENVDLARIDRILSQMLSKPVEERMQEFLKGYFHQFLTFLLSKEGVFLTVVFAYCYVIYRMFMARFYWVYVLQFLLFNFFICDFVFTWINLYKKAEISKMADMSKYTSVPGVCNPEKMSSWQYLRSFFTTEDACQKFYEVNYRDIFWTVSPGLVLTEMFSNLVKRPLLTLGVVFAGTVREVYNAMPWPYNMIFLPVGLVFLCIIIAILLTFLFTGTVKLNLFHLLSFSVSGRTVNNSTSGPSVISNPRIEELLQRIEQLPLPESQTKATEASHGNKMPKESKDAPQRASGSQSVSRLEKLSSADSEVQDGRESATAARQVVALVRETGKVTVDPKKLDKLTIFERMCEEKEDGEKEIVRDGKGDAMKTSIKQEADNMPDLVSGGGDFL